eukprot:CAMPEP_0198246630 /NCGR_PEP_ID=MMETSP1446-20131203/46068_1 /TAXON_ID=1461542 ORGANISM="Unidentified sp, Strain CCMP2111" /NCGR_SAMPLE_ID=MMETSP1446 /ASSEMBLY_ACC=CAM_ASM_001112 /LENGTH=891 /DNA_ID=CAMNT_0043930953 /DNA_START=253 /DNA_END=2929 /DNA_ORIENTATION=-
MTFGFGAGNPTGDDALTLQIGKSKSFAAKSLGEGDKTGVQITLHNLTYRVPAPRGEERYLLGGLPETRRRGRGAAAASHGRRQTAEKRTARHRIARRGIGTPSAGGARDKVAKVTPRELLGKGVVTKSKGVIDAMPVGFTDDNHPGDDGFHVEISAKSFGAKSLGEGEKTGVQITLHNLTYRVPAAGGKRGEERYLLGGLEPLTGTLDPGNMIALMGSSGAGKSTLMDVISKRKTVGIIEGLVLFDGHVPTHGEIGRDTGYVEQKDTLWGVFSVHEMLMYTALLKMDAKFSRKQKAARVDEVIEQMGLTKSRNTKIGGAMVRGVSGGEAKRISIGLGLLNNPRVLFLDEPTSGLDSAIALDIMTRVSDLSKEGRTVLCTVHQGSGRIFALFESVIVLCKDLDTQSGNIVYCGKASRVLEYFQRSGYPFKKKEVDNTTAYLMNIIGGGVKGPNKTEIPKLFELFANSEACKSNTQKVEKVVQRFLDGTSTPMASPLSFSDGGEFAESSEQQKNSYSNSILSEIAILVEFKGRNQFKDMYFLTSRIVLYAVAALLIVSLYVLPEGYSPTGLAMMVTVIFVVLFVASIISIIYVPGIILEKPVFLREINGACYRTTSYCAATFIIEATASVISSLLFCNILYWAIPGFTRRASTFFFFVLTHIIVNWTSIAITFTISAPLPSIEIAAGIIAIYSLLNLAIMGFLSKVPDWWGWASFISYLRWGLGAFMINQFSDAYFPFCQDVPDPSNITELLELISSVASLKSLALAGRLSSDNIACGLLRLPSNITDVLSVCPVLSDPPLFNMTDPATLETVFACTPQIANLVVSSVNRTEIYSQIGYLLLSFYPQGTNYPARKKYLRYNKWECLGYVGVILVAFFFFFCMTTLLSTKLSKR